MTIGSRADAGQVSRCAKNSIQKSYGRPISFLPIEPTPVADGLQLSRTVHYTLGQAAHHGWTGDPMLEASLVPDLLGYRVLVPEARELLARFVPSITDSDLMRHLEGLALAPGVELRHLAESAASAVGLVALQGRSGTVVQARIAAVHAGRQLGASTGQLSTSLTLSERAIRDLGSKEPDPRRVRAILFQIGLREQIGTLALTAPPARPATPRT